MNNLNKNMIWFFFTKEYSFAHILLLIMLSPLINMWYGLAFILVWFVLAPIMSIVSTLAVESLNKKQEGEINVKND